MTASDAARLKVCRLLPSETRRAAEVCYLARALRHEPHDYGDDPNADIMNDALMMDVQLKNPDTRIIAVKDEQKNILGITSYYKKESSVICTRFYTLPSDQKPGGALMQYFQQDAKEMGAKHVWLVAATDDSMGFYGHYGFYKIHADGREMEKYVCD